MLDTLDHHFADTLSFSRLIMPINTSIIAVLNFRSRAECDHSILSFDLFDSNLNESVFCHGERFAVIEHYPLPR